MFPWTQSTPAGPGATPVAFECLSLFEFIESGHRDRMSSVTTVIVTRDHSPVLLKTIARHAPPVIVIDNVSRDGSADAIRREFPQVTVLQSARVRGAHAFNLGARTARTRYVAFVDHQSWWESKSLERGARVLDENHTIGLIGASVRRVSDHRVDPLSSVLANSPLGGEVGLPGVPALGFIGRTCLVRRQPFLDVGGFDRVGGYGGEEQRLALDMADAGWAIRYFADLTVWREGRFSSRVRSLQVRDDLLTALMRRPMRVSLLRASTYLHHDFTGWLGVLGALILSPYALSRRRTVSPRVETRAQQLENHRRAMSRWTGFQAEEQHPGS